MGGKKKVTLERQLIQSQSCPVAIEITLKKYKNKNKNCKKTPRIWVNCEKTLSTLVSIINFVLLTLKLLIYFLNFNIILLNKIFIKTNLKVKKFDKNLTNLKFVCVCARTHTNPTHAIIGITHDLLPMP